MTQKVYSTLLAETSLDQDLYYYIEQEKLSAEIENLTEFLDGKNILNHTHAQQLKVNQVDYNLNFSNDNFTILAKNNLFAVIIGGLLLIAAGRLIYAE
jgi:hypothetical protein